jgi:hypothetical protein
MLVNFEKSQEQYTLLENSFITAHLPYASGDAVRVYLFGLYVAEKGSFAENSVEGFSAALNIPEEKVLEHFLYWMSKGLVDIKSKVPLEVIYLPPKTYAKTHVRKFSEQKFSDFNKQANMIFSGRNLLPNELTAYYELIEDTGVSQEALIMVMQYCVKLKGMSVSAAYIIAVAKDWAAGGRLDVRTVENRLKEHEALTEELRQVYFELGKKSSPEFEDKQTYLKWTKDWGFTHDGVLYAGSLCKKKGGFARVEKYLEEFMSKGHFTTSKMQDYISEKDKKFKLTLEVARRLTCYFQNLDWVIESYTAPWLNMGLSEEEILAAATACFKKNKRDFEAMDNYLRKGKKPKTAIEQQMTEDEYENMLIRKAEEQSKKLRGE